MVTMGYATQFALGPQHATSLATRQFEFQSCTLNKRQQLVQTEGIRGQRAPIGDATQAATYQVNGNVLLLPRPDDLDFLLPYILGEAEDADTFAFGESLPELVATIDKSLYVETYRGIKIAQATFRSSQGRPLTLELQFEGRTKDTPAAAGSFPDIAETLSTKLPYIHHHASWTFDGTGIEVDQLVLTIDNRLETNHYGNSQSRSRLPEGESSITLAFQTPHDANFHAKLRDINPSGISAASLQYDNGTDRLTVDFGRLLKPETPVDIRGKQSLRPEVILEAAGDHSGSRPIIQFTNTNSALS